LKKKLADKKEPSARSILQSRISIRPKKDFVQNIEPSARPIL